MKAIYLTTIAMLATFAVPALADTKTMLGCEVVDKGGYLNKTDPTCVFTNEDTRGSRLQFDSDVDNDPATDDPGLSVGDN